MENLRNTSITDRGIDILSLQTSPFALGESASYFRTWNVTSHEAQCDFDFVELRFLPHHCAFAPPRDRLRQGGPGASDLKLLMLGW